MIFIANPIYDVVFKYLLEDLSIAKGLFSRIIGEEIESLEVKSQETMHEDIFKEHPGLRLLRLDFKAVICIPNPLYNPQNQASKESPFLRKKILIELQKAKELFDIMRFRKYLGDNYSKADTFIDKYGDNQTEALPIISIYFLGFTLKNVPVSVLKVGKKYENALDKQEIFLEHIEPFIDLLTHESYMIQLNRLEKKYQTPLENILMLFSQKYAVKDDRQKLLIDENTQDELVAIAQKRLERAVSDEDFRRKMDIEDEMERTILKKLKDQEIELAEKDILLEEERKKNAQKDMMLAEKDQVLAEKDQALLVERQKAAELAAELEELRKRLK